MCNSVFSNLGELLQNEESFNQSLKIVEKYKEQKLVIVCSALFGITNKLIEYGNSSIEPGEILDAAHAILDEIIEKHQKFVNRLIQNPDLRNEMSQFIEDKVQQLKDFQAELKKDGLTNQNSDFLVSYGERMSALLYTEFLKSRGYNAVFVPTDEDFIITDDEFGNALPLLEPTEKNIQKKLGAYLDSQQIVVLPGFYGSTTKGFVTTLGRGGSDFTATIVGYAMAPIYKSGVIFWKDVNGILSANPNYVPHAKLLRQLSYQEAKELAYFGTKILHPKCLKTAEQRGVTAEIRNFDDPFSENYSQITKDCIIPRRSNEIIKAITSLDQIAMVTIESDAMISLPGSAAKVFSIMGEYNININFISQSSSENNITFGTSAANGFKASRLLAQNPYFGKHWFKVKVDHEVSLISVVGAGMMHKPGVAGLLFTTLGNAGVNIIAIAQGSSELNITLVVSRNDLKRAIKVIHETFIEGNIPTKISRW